MLSECPFRYRGVRHTWDALQWGAAEFLRLETGEDQGATVWALQVLAFEIDLVLIRNVCDPGESLCRDKPTTQQRVP